ncbi:MAG: HAD family hydrolase [Candidatus Eisenbacteria bacterium]|nr:HAD family hydrolase [Candidatus Eisenbacteria bacterium]
MAAMVFSFDIGNTLLQGAAAGGYCTHFSRHVGISFEELRPVFNECFLSLKQPIEDATRMACDMIGFSQPEAVVRCYHPEAPQVFSDAIPCLTRLREAGAKTIAVSNCSPWEASGLEELGLTQLLDEVVYSFQAGSVKPEAAIFQHALSRLGADPCDVTHIGDSWRADVKGALNAGWNAIFLDRRKTPGRQDHRDERVQMVHSLAEIAPL